MTLSKISTIGIAIAVFAATSSSTAFAGRKLKGYYKVPNVEQSDEFFVKGERLKEQRESYSFSMPMALFGIEKEIVVTFAENSVTQIEGTLEKQCDVSGRNVACTVKFDPIEIDVDAATDWILSQPISEQEMQAKLAVLAAFSGEPIGILKYRRKGGD